VIVPPGARSDALDLVNGVVLIGGDDYRAGNGDLVPVDFTPVDIRRERADFAMAREAIQRDLPVFAICAGFQLLALSGGGTIYGDLESELSCAIDHRRAHPDDPLPSHDVDWVGHPLVPSAPPGRYSVNSHHHQAVRKLPPGWKPLATTSDGVIEAAIGPGRFQCGVQWHPERGVEELSLALLDAFVSAVRARDSERGLRP